MTDLFPDLPPDEKPPQGLWDAKRTNTFDGAVYEEAKDVVRLTGQLERVYAVLSGAQPFNAWFTVEEIAIAIRAREGILDPECSISAQIRNLRKDRFGGHTIEKRRRGDEHSAVWEYRLVITNERERENW